MPSSCLHNRHSTTTRVYRGGCVRARVKARPTIPRESNCTHARRATTSNLKPLVGATCAKYVRARQLAQRLVLCEVRQTNSARSVPVVQARLLIIINDGLDVWAQEPAVVADQCHHCTSNINLDNNLDPASDGATAINLHGPDSTEEQPNIVRCLQVLTALRGLA